MADIREAKMDRGNNLLETFIVTNDEQAETKKEEGNVQYKLKNYYDALQLYTEAIEMCPEIPAYYNNRAACEMMLGRYDRALADVRQAIRLDKNFVKAHLRETKCHIALGDTPAAIRALETVKALDPNNVSVDAELKNIQQIKHFEEEAIKDLIKKDYRRAVFSIDRAMMNAVACKRFKILKAECLAFLQRYQESQEIINDLLKTDSMNADAIYVRGICLYYQDNMEKALSHFQRVLKLAPDHEKAQQIYKRAKLLKYKKEEGNEAFKARRFKEAYDLYSEALQIDSLNTLTNAKLYCNRATVASKIDKLAQAVEDCTKAIELDKDYIKAYLRRAKCYMDLKQYEDAVRDYEKALQMDNNREIKQLLQDAKLAMKKSKRKDYYQILGLDHNANDDEIRKAYRKRALVHHPDRHANASEEVKKEEEKKFKEVGEAYGVLSDPKKRSRYDNGYDLEEMDGFQDIDPNNIFQAFFGGPGHFQFSAGPNMANGFASNFPGGGFTFQFG